MFIKTSFGGFYNLAHFTRIFIEDHPDLDRCYIIGESYQVQYTLGAYYTREAAEEEINKIFKGENVYTLHDINTKSVDNSNELSFNIA